MANCRRCGKPYHSEDNFCGFCGFNLAAQETSEMATRISLKTSHINFDLGMRYFTEGKYEQAIALFEKTLADDPTDVRAREFLDKARLQSSQSSET